MAFYGIFIINKSKSGGEMVFITFDSKEEKNEFYYLYEKYNKLLYKYAFEILQNHQDTEDVLQVAWLKISNNIEKIITETERRKVNFLITVLRNSAYDKYNERKTPEIDGFDQMEYMIDSKKYDYIYKLIELSDFKEAVNSLNEKYKIPLFLKYTYGYSTKEIAEIMNISETNVGTVIYRAKNMIKEFIANLGDK